MVAMRVIAQKLCTIVRHLSSAAIMDDVCHADGLVMMTTIVGIGVMRHLVVSSI